ncbi:hypothetical protein [Staphylococcus saccharolyticus]|uniref:Uncharacterized protein n=1 Tax=Staphylococcus saccharolyticus TaxID=33028 RepID=A0A380GYD5_9STAP|nr:hypothetical protein [Staphylococcus saccharolyticus]SUM67268.1 Uncharacterised protein [Staphylococcus saccharolyticus]
MKNFEKRTVRKIALGTSSSLLATLIAANGTGLANAAETLHHNEHQQTTLQNYQKKHKTKQQ